MTDRLKASGVPTISLIGVDSDLVVGDSAAQHQVRGPTYEILRAMAGRRSLAEAEELLDWTTTPTETKLVFPVYDWLEESRRQLRAYGCRQS